GEVALQGLDPAPLQGKAVRVVAERAGQVEVLLEPVIVVARRPGAMRHPAGLLPVPPVVEVAVPLDLVRGGGGSPQEAGREAEVRGMDIFGKGVRAGGADGPAGGGGA